MNTDRSDGDGQMTYPEPEDQTMVAIVHPRTGEPERVFRRDTAAAAESGYGEDNDSAPTGQCWYEVVEFPEAPITWSDLKELAAGPMRVLHVGAEPGSGRTATRTGPMLWIAYNPSISDHEKNREQFNGDKPAWGESPDDHFAKQGIDVPQVGDELNLRMGMVTVTDRRLEAPERDDAGNRVTDWYWTVIVR